jgi:UDP-N-acetylmuramoylalanine--D-glutamate ligase
VSAGRVVVVGFARTGRAAARVLRDRGASVVAIDDRPAPSAREDAESLGIEFLGAPEPGVLAAAVTGAELIVVSPGVPPTHPVFSLAAPGQLVAELELASRLCTKPIVAITGTNGKTTVTNLVGAMLRASGRAVATVGNIGRAFIEAVDDPVDLFVVEASSFQLAFTSTFRPQVATWLNFAEDHLDWHADLAEYAASKAKIFANQGTEDVAVVNVSDPVVCAAVDRAAARAVTFGPGGTYDNDGGMLVGPRGPICSVAALPRALPHDVDNALAAAATAIEAGADAEACADALATTPLPPHRVALVATIAGVPYYDDSKATTPSAVLAALAGFPRAVLIAGGQNKGLHLGVLGEFAADHPGRVRAVVAIGDAATEVARSFAELPVVPARSMHDAVRAAADLALPGDAVLLSPGCASFDWYRSYEERGDDFAAEVRALMAEVAS